MSESAINAPHLTSESECPPYEDDLVRFYNMHFCPFSQRVRIVLKAKNVKTDTVNINLKDKPEWFMEISPLGKVPAIQKKDDVLFESMVLCDYLDEAYPHPRLYPDHPWLKARDKALIDLYSSKVVSPFHKVFGNPQEPEDVELIAQSVRNGLDIFEEELDNRGTKYFFGDEPGMIDFAVFPWFERFRVAQAVFPDLLILVEDRFPKLMAYADAMLESEAASSSSPAFEDHVKFMESHLAKEPNFDIGI